MAGLHNVGSDFSRYFFLFLIIALANHNYLPITFTLAIYILMFLIATVQISME